MLFSLEVVALKDELYTDLYINDFDYFFTPDFFIESVILYSIEEGSPSKPTRPWMEGHLGDNYVYYEANGNPERMRERLQELTEKWGVVEVIFARILVYFVTELVQHGERFIKMKALRSTGAVYVIEC